MTNKVLIVNNSSGARGFLKFLFELDDYQVIEASDGYEAIEKAEAEQPDLILMDMSMPGMDGLTASKIIKEKMAQTKVPNIVGVTAYGRDYHEKAIAAGCQTVISKPVSLDAIDSIIGMYLID